MAMTSSNQAQTEIQYFSKEPNDDEWDIGIDNILDLIPYLVKIKPKMTISEHA